MTASAELPAESRLAGLTLRVRDLEAQLGFYRDRLGLSVVDRADDRVALAPDQRAVELVLVADPDAPRRPHPSVGLFHLALLVPTRGELADVLLGLQETGVRLDGASDHGVSEALYLSDPEGNGIEIYRDREPGAWPRRGDEVAMVTDTLDVEDLLSEGQGPTGLPPGTRLGHIHLRVPDLEQAGRFYRALGLQVTQSTYPGALFLAAGGYHHHVGLNVWAGRRMAPEGATGLVSYTWEVPAAGLEQLDQAPVDGLEAVDGERQIADPAGIEVRFIEG